MVSRGYHERNTEVGHHCLTGFSDVALTNNAPHMAAVISGAIKYWARMKWERKHKTVS
jgi:hypothetical protein